MRRSAASAVVRRSTAAAVVRRFRQLGRLRVLGAVVGALGMLGAMVGALLRMLFRGFRVLGAMVRAFGTVVLGGFAAFAYKETKEWVRKNQPRKKSNG